jgi:tetratricopeptide (TPR) repeat protein
VRIEAASVVAGVPDQEVPSDDAGALREAIAEYVATQEFNADRPEAHLNLALLFAHQREFAKAESQLHGALSLEPSFTPAVVNLADLYREMGRDAAGERVLNDALARAPDDGALQHALGLLLVREGQRRQALEHLAAAARLDPSNARFVYTWALALDDAGQTAPAIEALEAELRRHPYDHDSLAALAGFYGRTGNPQRGAEYASRLVELEPDNAQARQLLNQLRGEAERR